MSPRSHLSSRTNPGRPLRPKLRSNTNTPQKTISVPHCPLRPASTHATLPPKKNAPDARGVPRPYENLRKKSCPSPPSRPSASQVDRGATYYNSHSHSANLFGFAMKLGFVCRVGTERAGGTIVIQISVRFFTYSTGGSQSFQGNFRF